MNLLALITLALAGVGPSISKATTATNDYTTTTHWYTTCGAYYGDDVQPSIPPVGVGWQPLIGFFFTKEGHRDSRITEGISKFFQRYAECGLSRHADVILPQRDAVASFHCADDTCASNFTLCSGDELTVKWGENIHLISRLLAYVDRIEESTPMNQRVLYGFTNVDCNIDNSRIYPDFCRYTLPPNTLDILFKKVQLNLIWLTVRN
ncbi:hypothetical protein AAVH_24454 [Aphelenchoides avenae]|nr:hypothetical protein AAVH_24454 [Aphelenchus avenae]